MDRLTLSHSQLETWEQCPARWFHQKIMRYPQAPSDALILGDAVHGAIEEDGKLRRLGVGGWTQGALYGAFVARLDERLAHDDSHELLSAAKRHEMRLRGQAMLRAYHQGFAPDYHPTEVEAAFPDVLLEPENDEGEPPIRFTGRIDARVDTYRHTLTSGAAETTVEPIRRIVDFKTASKPWAYGAEHAKPQADAYLWAEARGYERLASGVLFVVMTTRQTAEGRWSAGIDLRATTRAPQQLAAYERRVRATGREIAAAKASPTPAFALRTGPLCGWCPSIGHCEEGKQWLRSHGRTPAVPMVDIRGEPVAWE